MEKTFPTDGVLPAPWRGKICEQQFVLYGELVVGFDVIFLVGFNYIMVFYGSVMGYFKQGIPT